MGVAGPHSQLQDFAKQNSLENRIFLSSSNSSLWLTAHQVNVFYKLKLIVPHVKSEYMSETWLNWAMSSVNIGEHVLPILKYPWWLEMCFFLTSHSLKCLSYKYSLLPRNNVLDSNIKTANKIS